MLQALKNMTCTDSSQDATIESVAVATAEQELEWELEHNKEKSLFGTAAGVIRTCVGFTGGDSKAPTYRRMGNHTETVLIEYDPEITSYENMLDIFWKNHDYTSKHSRQYMSAIFYHNPEQKRLAEESLKKLSAEKIVKTVILPAKTFFPAEDYHQKYMLQRHPYILAQLGIEPGEELIRSYTATRLNGYVGGYGTMDSFDHDLQFMTLPLKIESYVRNIIPKRKKPCST